MSNRPCVVIVHDDDQSCSQLHSIAATLGVGARRCASLKDLLREEVLSGIGCAVVGDAHVNGSVRAWQEALLDCRAYLPIIVLAEQCSVPEAVSAVRAGAQGVLLMPIDGTQAAAEIRAAVAKSQRDQEFAVRRHELRKRIAQLTPREQDVLALVKLGMTSREIAADLERSTKTVELHRTHILQKLGVRNAVQLVRDLAMIEFEHWQPF